MFNHYCRELIGLGAHVSTGEILKNFKEKCQANQGGMALNIRS